MHAEKFMGGLVFAGGLALLVGLLGAGMVAAAENPEKAPAAEAPGLPGVPPMVRRSVDELPAGPETPADQLPPDYFAALGTVCLHYNQWGKAEELARKLMQSQSKPVATLAKRLLFDIYSEQNKLDQLDIKPEAP